MPKRSIILYWLLLLVPTLLIGAAAFQLLRHEQERIDKQARFSAQDRARAIGDTLQVTVGAIQDELTEALHRIPADSLSDTLNNWTVHNPLVRNAFVWSPRRGLLLPQPGPSATTEEKRFIARYEALLTGRIPWNRDNSEAVDVAGTALTESSSETDVGGGR